MAGLGIRQRKIIKALQNGKNFLLLCQDNRDMSEVITLNNVDGDMFCVIPKSVFNSLIRLNLIIPYSSMGSLEVTTVKFKLNPQH
jgi:hypothetical protein